ncbi:tRNA pseudouridine(38-40) synthase TruA [soil metagenome]
MPNDIQAGRRRFKLIVAYDGALFSGWQSQVRGDTIQDRLEGAVAKITGQEIRVHGAGRTDAGVHALGQCAHVDLPPTRLDPLVLVSALNASLPPQIRILRGRFVAPTFHARFSARGKVYRYRIATTPVLSPFELGRAWHLTGQIDDKLLRASAERFVGRHDFAGFAANRGHRVGSTLRTIHRIRVARSSSVTTIEFEGDGFLYKMVRLMVGAIGRCAQGKTRLDELSACLHGGPGCEPRLVAPAGGLTLVRVLY